MPTVKEFRHAEYFVVFGSGDIAHFEDYMPYVNDKGESRIKFWFTRDAELERRYDLKYGQEIDPENGLIEMDYPSAYVSKELNGTPEQRLFIIKLNFLGGHTEYSLMDQGQAEQIRILQRQNRILSVASSRLQEELVKAMTQQEKLLAAYKRMANSVQSRTQNNPQDLLQQQGETK